MTGEEQTLREQFDAAYDGELSAEQTEAFERALSARPALRQEYDDFCRVMRATSQLSRTPEVDVLRGVQQRLRARSGGRFYRDRFAELRGRSAALVWILAIASLALFSTAAWLLWDALVVPVGK